MYERQVLLQFQQTGLNFIHDIVVLFKLFIEFVTSWEIDGETVERVADFIFWGSKITADGDCSHEIKRHFLEEKLWPT